MTISRIRPNPLTQATRPGGELQVKPALAERMRKIFTKVNTAGLINWQAAMPLGVRFVRVPLYQERHPDGFSYTALVPVGALAPKAKLNDPNKAEMFYVERSGGIAGITSYSGPFPLKAGGAKTDPFFAKYLEGQQRSRFETLKYPSDAEDGGGGRGGRIGDVVTLKYPSDNEDGGGIR